MCHLIKCRRCHRTADKSQDPGTELENVPFEIKPDKNPDKWPSVEFFVVKIINQGCFVYS